MVLCFITSPELRTPCRCLVRGTYHRWSVCRRAFSSNRNCLRKPKEICLVLIQIPRVTCCASHQIQGKCHFPPRGVSPCCPCKAHLLFRDSCLLLYAGVDKAPEISWLLLFSSYFFPTKTYFILFVFVCLVPSGEILELFRCCGFREMKWLQLT